MTSSRERSGGSRPDTPNDRPELKAFLDRAYDELSSVIISGNERFPTGAKLLQRFGGSITRLFKDGWRHLDEVVEVHNEVCTAIFILEDSEDPGCSLLEYEPSMSGCSKRFDFRADFSGMKSKWLEVKTVHPKAADRWNQYERDVNTGRFPEHATLSLSKEWLGGELYHKFFSARAKLLEHTLELEAKITQCLPAERGPVFLVLFSNGFDWNVDTLEDFLHFYRFGRHFEGDHFSQMEMHHIAERQIRLTRKIDYFAYVERPTGSVRPTKGRWNVEPIRFSPEKGYY